MQHDQRNQTRPGLHFHSFSSSNQTQLTIPINPHRPTTVCNRAVCPCTNDTHCPTELARDFTLHICIGHFLILQAFHKVEYVHTQRKNTNSIRTIFKFCQLLMLLALPALPRGGSILTMRRKAKANRRGFDMRCSLATTTAAGQLIKRKLPKKC